MLFLKAEHNKEKKKSSRFALHKLFEFPSLSYFPVFKRQIFIKVELLPFTYDAVF